MKKIFLSIIITFISTILNAQNVFIPDANFKKLLVFDPTINLNLDNEIQVSEAKTVTEIQVDGALIKDLTGIEYFSNLQILDASYNNFRKIDLRGIYTLKEVSLKGCNLDSIKLSPINSLKIINLDSNNLKSLDFSNFIFLTDININKNQFSNLDLSQNLSLKNIYASNNQLISVKFNNKYNLSNLYLQNNKIQSLSLTNMTNLINLDISGNELISVCLSNNVYLNSNQFKKDAKTQWWNNCEIVNIYDKNFKNKVLNDYSINTDKDTLILQREIDTVSTLNISNLNISNLSGLEKFINLKNLDASYNNLSNFNFNNLPSLEKIFISHNKLSSFAFLPGNTLKVVDIGNNLITNQIDFTNVNKIEVFKADSNLIESIYFSNAKTLTTIDLRFNKLKSIIYIYESTSLTHLDLTLNSLLNKICIGNVRNLPNTFLKDANAVWVDCFNPVIDIDIFDITIKNYLLSSKYNLNKDLDIQVSEANLIDTLILTNKNIKHIKGIEQFNALKCLKLDSNQIDSCKLYVKSNLSKFSISNNKLKYLDLYYEKEDINPGLDLDFSYNYIKNINFNKQLTLIRNLNCSYNFLEKLDLTNVYFYNEFYLDASHNKIIEFILPQIELSSGYLGLNLLQYINLSHNQLHTFSQNRFNAVSILNLESNFIESINFDNLFLLKNVNLNSNNLSNLDLYTLINLESVSALSNINLKSICVFNKDSVQVQKDNTTIITDECVTGPIIKNLSKEFYNYLISNGVDKDNDKRISINETKDIKRLNLSNNNISSLSGIEYFEELTYLNVSNNNIKKIELDNNLKIDTLIANYVNLDSINVNKLSNLIYLSLDSSGIKKLNIKSNLILEYLSVCLNELEYINLENNILLKEVNITGMRNKIDSINLKSLKSLTSLRIGMSSLKYIEFGSLDKMIEIGFWFMNIESLKLPKLSFLKQLNFFSCKKINILDLSDLKYINKLYIYDDTINSIIFPKNLGIDTLNIFNSKLNTKIDIQSNIKHLLLSNCTQIDSLNLNYSTNLETLTIPSSPVKNINLPVINKLKEIRIVYANLEQLNGLEFCENLERLHLPANNLKFLKTSRKTY